MIFLMGSFAARERLRAMRARLQDLGFLVLATWVDSSTETWPEEEPSKNEARRDIRELEAAQAVILDTLDASTLGNSYVELGIAIARGYPITLIGPARNHYTLLIENRFETWEAYLATL